MPVNEKYLAKFEPGKSYHIYNKTNNRELLFRSSENYRYFLKQYAKYLSPFIETFAWSLLPNHFHLIVRVKTEPAIIEFVKELPVEIITKTEKQFLTGKDIDLLLETTFKRFFTSYAMAYNKMYDRSGNLFYRTFKRIELSDSHFTQGIIYVHANALKHKIVKDFRQYLWSSYQTILTDKPTNLLRNEILTWFGGKERFIKAHQEMTGYYYDFPGLDED